MGAKNSMGAHLDEGVQVLPVARELALPEADGGTDRGDARGERHRLRAADPIGEQRDEGAARPSDAAEQQLGDDNAARREESVPARAEQPHGGAHLSSWELVGARGSSAETLREISGARGSSWELVGARGSSWELVGARGSSLESV